MINLLALSLIPKVGRQTLSKLIQRYGYGHSLHEYIEFLMQDFPSKKKYMQSVNLQELLQRASEILETSRQKGYDILLWFDQKYPVALKKANGKPPFLFATRNFRHYDNAVAISFVTSGRTTSQGYNVIDTVLSSARPLYIYTGFGDTANIYATKRGLELEQVFVTGVLPCGIDVVYPPNHSDIYHQVAEKGRLLSEYIFGERVEDYKTIERDALVVSCSDALVVVEGKYAGRVKRLVELAMSQGKPVFYSPALLGWSEAVEFLDSTGLGIPLEELLRT